MEKAHPDQPVRPADAPPPGPPANVYMTVGEMPEAFRRDVLKLAFADYSVALGRLKNGIYCPLGSGVLVRKGKHFGILTAHHCLHACSPELRLGSVDGDTLWLSVKGGRAIFVKPQEVREHPLGEPNNEEFGPDLTFIEILSIERLGTFKAVGSFWSRDRQPCEIMQAFGMPLSPIASIGFPEVYYNTKVEGNNVRHQIRHMVYQNAIAEGDMFEKDGWDYLDSTMSYLGEPDLPPTFAGVSGGPVWGMELLRHKSDGHISIGEHALIGITFYEVYRKGDEARLRAHFIKSIYDLAWRNFVPSGIAV